MPAEVTSEMSEKRAAGAESGWPWMQEKLTEQDSAVMTAYTEDIDSLLVLDGLFSAVVTAFIVISITMLQPNTGQATVDSLLQISQQISTLSFSLAPPFLNATTQAVPTSLASLPQPMVAARWINILWFLSLLFSLASAVFGILVKQWVREYLQWRSPTAGARKNVIVRQIRAESWKEWRTPIIISSIPALLEIAVVLFVGGMTILLWTLDYVVAIVVSHFVAIFLLFISFFTLMPAVRRRCPYKSPTAWAFVLLCERAKDACARLYAAWLKLRFERPPDPESPLDFCTHFENAHVVTNCDEDGTWRGRDLRGAELTSLLNPQGSVDAAQSVLLQELDIETVGTLCDIPLPRNKTLSRTTLAPSIFSAYLLALGESDILFRALVGLMNELPDDVGLHHIAECVQSLQQSLDCASHYTALPEPVQLSELAVDGGFRNISIWYMLSRINATGAGHMGSFLSHPCTSNAAEGSSSVATYILSVLRSQLRGLELPPLPNTFIPPLSDACDRILPSVETPESRSQYIVMSCILAARFRTCVAEALHPVILLQTRHHPVVQMVSRRLDELLEALRCVAFVLDLGSSQSRACRTNCATILARAFNRLARHPDKAKFDELFPFLRYNIFLILSPNEYKLQFRRHNILELRQRSIDGSSLPASELMSLVAQFSLDTAGISLDDFAIFALLVNNALFYAPQLLARDMHYLFSKASIALRYARVEGSEEAYTLLYYDWPRQLVRSVATECGAQPICRIAFARAPRPFLRFLFAMQADEPAVVHTSISDVLHHIHLPSPLIYPIPATENVPLRNDSHLLQSYSLSLATALPEWLGLFVGAANQWMLEVRNELARCPPGTMRPALDAIEPVAPTILAKMADAVSAAVEQRYLDCGYVGGTFPWLDTMLPVGNGRTNGADATRAPVTAFLEIAPAKLDALVNALEAAADAGLFSSPAAVDDVEFLRVLLQGRSPQEHHTLS